MLNSAFCVLALLLLIGIPRPALSQQKPQPEPFLDVALECPVSKDSGTLDRISLNSIKHRRIRVVYRFSKAVGVDISVVPREGQSVVPREGQFENSLNHRYTDLSVETDPDYLDFAEVFIRDANKIKSGVCEGTAEDKRRYQSTLEANKASLR